MNFTEAQLAELSKVACDAAVAAGEHIVQCNRDELKTQIKKSGTSEASSVVTQIDIECEAIIRRILEPSLEKYDLAWLAEEGATNESPNNKTSIDETFSSSLRLTKHAFWCVDPLDGTLSFVNGEPGYAVSIALVLKTGEPIIGVVFDPIRKQLYSCTLGLSASLPTQPQQKSDDILTLHADRSFKQHPLASNCLLQLNALAVNLGYRQLNMETGKGAVMNACAVLKNPHSFYLKLPKIEHGGGSIWDFAATHVLFTHNDLPVTDCHNHPLQLNRPDTLFMNECGVLYAGSNRIHRAILAKLSQVLDHPG